jgi:hypothetical protein
VIVISAELAGLSDAARAAGATTLHKHDLVPSTLTRSGWNTCRTAASDWRHPTLSPPARR